MLPAQPRTLPQLPGIFNNPTPCCKTTVVSCYLPPAQLVGRPLLQGVAVRQHAGQDEAFAIQQQRRGHRRLRYGGDGREGGTWSGKMEMAAPSAGRSAGQQP